MDQTYNHSLFADAREEPDHSGTKRAKIFLVVLLVFAGLVALAVAMQKSQPTVSRVTTETSTAAQSVPPPVDATAVPAVPAAAQAVPPATEEPAAAPTAEKSAVETAPAVARTPAGREEEGRLAWPHDRDRNAGTFVAGAGRRSSSARARADRGSRGSGSDPDHESRPGHPRRHLDVDSAGRGSSSSAAGLTPPRSLVSSEGPPSRAAFSSPG